jgi:hypothetical protein
VRGAPERSRESERPQPAAGWFGRDLETDKETEAEMYYATASPRQEQRSPVAIWSRLLALGLLVGGPATTSVTSAQRRTRGEIGSARATDRERDERDLLQFFSTYKTKSR